MAQQIVAQTLMQRLADWGIDTIFGLPGDGINGLMEGLRRTQDRIKFVLVHHEEAAAFMATGHAKLTGQVGVCMATSGPGGIHLLNGLYDAKLDHMPVLAITGMQETQLLGTGYQQEVHLDKLYMDVAGYNQMIYVPDQTETIVDLAIRHALSSRSVSHITIPVDVQIAPAHKYPYEPTAPARKPQTAPIYMKEFKTPPEAQLIEAANVLNSASKVVILAGAGALGARKQVIEVAEKLAAPIVKTLPGKAVVPDNHPLTTGGLGLLGTLASEEAMEKADTLFMIGTNFPYTKFLPSPKDVKVVQIEIDPFRAGNRIPTEIPLVGDTESTLEALIKFINKKTDQKFISDIQASMKKWNNKMRALEDPNRDPIQPQYLMKLINQFASNDAILASDSGTIATWAARHFEIRDKREFYLSGNLATMAPGLPYTIAAQLVHPNRQCIGFVGDGGFAMLMAEFLTALRHKLPIKIFISNNGEYGQILWEQMVLGYPEFGVRHNEIAGHKYADFSTFAHSNNGFGIHVSKASELEDAVSKAFAFDGPALVDVEVNPNEPPMPAKVTYEQAKSFATAFLKGQPHKVSIASTLFRDKLESFTKDSK